MSLLHTAHTGTLNAKLDQINHEMSVLRDQYEQYKRENSSLKKENDRLGRQTTLKELNASASEDSMIELRNSNEVLIDKSF